MAALRLAARNLGVGALRRPKETARLISPAAVVVKEEQRRRLIHGYPTSAMASSPYSLLLRQFSSSTAGEPSTSSKHQGDQNPRTSAQRLDDDDLIDEIEEMKEELLLMVAQLELDNPSARSDYAFDNRKLLNLLADQLPHIEILHPQWPAYERRKKFDDRLTTATRATVVLCGVAGILKSLIWVSDQVVNLKQ